MQPFDESLYTGYSSYNNWAAKGVAVAAAATPSLAAKAGFAAAAWGLGAMHNAAQTGFNMTPSVTSSVATTSAPTPNYGDYMYAAAGSSVTTSSDSTTTTKEESIDPTSPSSTQQNQNNYNSIASLRLKAKQHNANNSANISEYSSYDEREATSNGVNGDSSCQYNLQNSAAAAASAERNNAAV